MVTCPLCDLSKLAPSLKPVEYEELNWKTHLGDITDSNFLDLPAECNEIFVRIWPVIGKIFKYKFYIITRTWNKFLKKIIVVNLLL